MINLDNQGRFESLTINLKTAIGITVAACVLVASVAGTLGVLAYRVAQLEDTVVGRGPRGWHKVDERQVWSDFGRLNPESRIPAVRNTFDRE